MKMTPKQSQISLEEYLKMVSLELSSFFQF